jgi:hypothetical protein
LFGNFAYLAALLRITEEAAAGSAKLIVTSLSSTG